MGIYQRFDAITFFDDDHAWINGQQFISLRRVNEMISERRTTNHDRVRKMSVLRLANLFADPCPPDQQCGRNTVMPMSECRDCWRRWLEAEA